MDVIREIRRQRAFRNGAKSSRRTPRIAAVGWWSLDVADLKIHWSDQVCRIHEVPLGHQPTLAETIGYFTPAVRDRVESAVQACIQHGISYDLEQPLVTAQGRSIWVRTAGEAEMRDGRTIRLFGVLQETSEKKFAESQLVEQHALLRVTLDSIGDAVITTDDSGLVKWLNPVAARLTGWCLDEALGKPIEQVFHIVSEVSRDRLPSPVQRVFAQDRASSSEPVLLLSRDGTEYGIQDSAAPIRDGNGASYGIVLVFHDVTEQRRLVHEIGVRAARDALTGLYNRSEFDVRLKRALESARQGGNHAVMFLDLDQFKIVNDTCGHAAGDRLLRQITTLFQSIIRSRDTFARLGGDEFGVLMENCTTAQARRVGERLCESLEHFRFVHEQRRFRIGASIGLVPLDSRWLDIASMLQAADTSCYAAKEQGGNRVLEWFDSDQRMKERHGQMQWVARLEEALGQDSFRLYGQRIVPFTAAQEGLHLEVLVRLRDPDGTIIAPAAFVPAAERFHLMSRIDRWVVRQVLRHLANVPLDAVETVAINLSGQSLSDRTFHRYVVELLSQVPLDRRKLCFEITETAAITHMEDAVEFIAAMRRLGVRIALDDFGAGASSFGYLKHLAVDFLKIDGQFVRDLLDDKLDHATVCCFRDVAAVCGLTTIAEFVESPAIYAELKRMGIHLAQGFSIHRPEPLDNLLGTDTPLAA